MKRLFSTRFRTRGAASTPGGADPLVRGRRPRRPVESRKGPQPLQQERDGGVPRRPGGPPHRSGRIPSLLILLALTALSALAQPGQLAPVQPTISMQDSYLKRYGRANTANGWHFLTGDEANIKALTDAVGYHYKYDPATDQFAHASG